MPRGDDLRAKSAGAQRPLRLRFARRGDFLLARPASTALGKNGWKFWHRLISNDDAQGQVDGDFIVKTLGAKKVFVIDDNQEYSVGLADKVFSTVQAQGVAPQRDKIDPKATDYSSTVNKVKAAKPDAIFFGGYYNGGDKLLKQVNEGAPTNGADLDRALSDMLQQSDDLVGRIIDRRA